MVSAMADTRMPLETVVEILRELAHEERDFLDSMSHGHGRALLDAAAVLSEMLDTPPRPQ